MPAGDIAGRGENELRRKNKNQKRAEEKETRPHVEISIRRKTTSLFSCNCYDQAFPNGLSVHRINIRTATLGGNSQGRLRTTVITRSRYGYYYFILLFLATGEILYIHAKNCAKLSILTHLGIGDFDVFVRT